MVNKIYRFTASWCNPCKMLAKYLEGADLGYPIEVVDIDVFPEVAELYGIRSVPTLVAVDSNGVAVGKMIGLKSTEQIKSWSISL